MYSVNTNKQDKTMGLQMFVYLDIYKDFMYKIHWHVNKYIGNKLKENAFKRSKFI